MTTPKDQTHSIYGASGASRWRQCPGSVRVIQKAKAAGEIPKRASSRFADEGTEAHEYADNYLKGKIALGDIPDNFREHLIGYINHCEEVRDNAIDLCGEEKVLVLNETMVPLFYRPSDRGTIDHGVVCPAFLHFTDLKYGAGIKVEAMDNDQGLIYTKSMVDELEIMQGYSFPDETPVFISIYQPRHYTFNGEPDTWEVSVGFLRSEGRAIEVDYEDALKDDGRTCAPSDKACMFCDAKGVCLARGKTSFGGLPPALNIEEDFDFEGDTKDDLPKGKAGTAYTEELRETLTPGQIAFICRNGSMITKFVKNVIEAETARLLAGGEIREMKLIPGKLGNRTWEDEEEAEKVVRSLFGAAESYKPRKLLTAPQVLAKAKPQIKEMSTIRKIQLGLVDAETAAKSKTKCLIHRPEGSPKLVPIDDPTEAMVFTAVQDDFDVEQ